MKTMLLLIKMLTLFLFLWHKTSVMLHSIKAYQRPDLLTVTLKLMSAIFYQIFMFSPNDSPSRNMKNVFYFI